MSAAEDYLVLGLRLGRHVDGLVDAYYGPPELKDQVDAEAARSPEVLADDAGGLAARLDDGWLRDQVSALRTYARVLAGEEISYSDEVEGCYGVRPTAPDEGELRAAHAELEAILHGDGPLVDRLESWRQTQYVTREALVPALRHAVAFMRDVTAELVKLPDGEALEVDAVEDEPWQAFNYYLGNLRSRVVVNLDIPTESGQLVELAAHEVYPGHHTEHALKEQLLLREQGRTEEAIQLVPTPQAVVSEGIATIGIDVLLDDAGRGRIADAIARHGVSYDHERAAAIHRATQSLRTVGLGAAIQIHEEGRSTKEVEAYLRRWSLRTPEQVMQFVRFLTDPTWRAYAITYVAGRRLCSAYVGDNPARLRTLLTEHVRVGDLIAAA